MNELVQLSTENLCRLAFPPPHFPRLQASITAGVQFCAQPLCPHYRAAAVVPSGTRWNLPEAMENDSVVSSISWLQVPLSQLKSRLSKVEPGAIKRVAISTFRLSHQENYTRKIKNLIGHLSSP